ncbi:hypothetical protein [Aquimarina sp. 2304DJ70-9]|uniref:hypothetical protein n=1 Tax=Aquimarina penaris TaxID=3231044 RepID=UPI003462EFB3
MKKIIFLLSFFITYMGHAQFYDINTIIPNSPSTAKFEEVFSPKVSEFNGTLDVTIPIYEIKVDEVTIPIYLRYDSSGVKVEEEASWVGQSWSLMAGGLVSRNQVGIPDDMNKNVGFVPTFISYLHPMDPLGSSSSSLCNTPQVYHNSGWFYARDKIQSIANAVENGSSISDTGHLGYYKAIGYGANDSAPDIFNAFLPNGQSENFFFNKRDEVHFFDKNSIAVNYDIADINKGIDYFSIKDNNGTTYKYNQKEYLRYQRDNFTGNTNPEYVSSAYTKPVRRSSSALSPHNFYTFWTAYGEGRCVSYSDPEAIKISERLWPKAWHTSEIETVKGNKIHFDHQTDTIFKLSNTFLKRDLYASRNVAGRSLHITWAYSSGNSFQKIAYPRLSEITWDQGRIEFISGDVREDVYKDTSVNAVSRTKSLDKVIIYDKFDNVIKEFELRYSYRNAEGYSSSLPAHEKSLYKRLFLDEVISKDKIGKITGSYKMTYNATKLPNKFSFEQDYWGYYNNNNANTFLPNLWWYPSEQRDYIDKSKMSLYPRTTYNGQQKRLNNYMDDFFPPRLPVNVFFADRRPNETYSKAGVLEKIEYPAGGELAIAYEQNQFLYRGKSEYGPGLRVSKTTLKESSTDTNAIVTDYIYNQNGKTTGRVRTLPMFTGLGRYHSADDPQEFYYISSHPINEFNNAFNGEFGYLRVEKKYSGGENGKEVKTFSFPIPLGKTNVTENGLNLYNTSLNNLYSRATYVRSFSSNPGFTTNSSDYFPYPSETNFSFAFGKPLSVKTYDNQNRILLDKTYAYEYSNNYNTTKALFDTGGEGRAAINYLSAKYQLIEDSSDYHDSGNRLNTSTSYVYNDDFLLSEKNFINSDGKLYTENYKYTRDFVYQTSIFEQDPFGNWYEIIQKNLYGKMIDKNMIHYPIETIKRVDNKVVSSELNKFKRVSLSNNRVTYVPQDYLKLETKVPLTDYVETSPSNTISGEQLSIDSRLKSSILYEKYNDGANITQYRESNGIPVTIIWGYHENYPIAKLENITYDQVKSYVNNLIAKSNQDNDRTIKYIGKEGALRKDLDELRTAFPLAMITTYTYDPLIGMTSETDPKGDTTYYEYDEYNRLKAVKNSDGNILTKNDYNYASQN